MTNNIVLYDGLGSVIALSNIDGDIVEAYSYDVYGTPTIYIDAGVDGIWRTSDDTTDTESAIGNPYMFTGRRWDAETGLYYYRARMYSPALGRFLQTDPIGYDDGMNMYTYCNNNPLNWIDPWGLERYGFKGRTVRIIAITVDALIPPERYTTGIQNVSMGVAQVSGGAALMIGTGGTASLLIGCGGFYSGCIQGGIGTGQIIDATNEVPDKEIQNFPVTLPTIVAYGVGGENARNTTEIVEGVVSLAISGQGYAQSETMLEAFQSFLEIINTMKEMYDSFEEVTSSKTTLK